MAATNAPDATGPSPRRRRGSLTRETIGRTALELLDDEGVTSLSMRRLAKRLGVKAPSLYNHVESLGDVIDLIQEQVNHEIDHSGFASDDLREGLAAVARSYRAAFERHPHVVVHVVRRVIHAPTALRLYDEMAEFMLRHGIPEGELLSCMAQLDGVVLGSSIDAFHDGFTRAADYRDTHPALAAALASSSPNAVDEAAFEASLDGMLTRFERLNPP